MDIKKRLKEERLRAGLSQKKMGELCGVSHQAAQNWEGRNPIPVEHLAVLAEHGFDGQYILTGVRSGNLKQVHEIKSKADEFGSRVSRLNESQRNAMLLLLEELEAAAECAEQVRILSGKCGGSPGGK